MEVSILKPHGFCTGVTHALNLARTALQKTPQGVYALHALVHNERICAELVQMGLRIVPSVADVPSGATLLFSAHGVTPRVRQEAQDRQLHIIDATCPFVMRAHRTVTQLVARGCPVVIVGHRAHVEVVGLLGEVEAAQGRGCVIATVAEVSSLPYAPTEEVGVVCQTTLDACHVDEVLAALRTRYPHLVTTPASDTCTATQDRQHAVQNFVRMGGDGVLVLGSPLSSNTCRLAECARNAGASFVARANTEAEVRACDFSTVRQLGITSGASTPEDFFTTIVTLFTKQNSALTARG